MATKTPAPYHRVLAWVEGEPYPFVGYYDLQDGWCMEIEYLNADNHRNDIFGEVVVWMEIPPKPEEQDNGAV